MGNFSTASLHGGRVPEEFGTCAIKHMLSVVPFMWLLPVFDENCLRSVNFVRSCITHRSNLVKFIARYSIFYGRGLGHQLAVMLYCAQRYSCAVEDLFFTQSARNAVN